MLVHQRVPNKTNKTNKDKQGHNIYIYICWHTTEPQESNVFTAQYSNDSTTMFATHSFRKILILFEGLLLRINSKSWSMAMSECVKPEIHCIDDNMMTIWWQYDDNIMTISWQYDHNIMAILLSSPVFSENNRLAGEVLVSWTQSLLTVKRCREIILSPYY